MTFLLIPQFPTNENLTSMLYISNSLIQSGHIVYCKTNPNQVFQNVRFDQVIEISVKPQIQPQYPSQIQQPQYPAQMQMMPNQQYPIPNQQFVPQNRPVMNQYPVQSQVPVYNPVQYPQQQQFTPNNFAPVNYPQPQTGMNYPVQNFQNNYARPIANTQAPQPTYPQPQNFNLLPKATQTANTPLPVELKPNNLPEFTPSPTVKR